MISIGRVIYNREVVARLVGSRKKKEMRYKEKSGEKDKDFRLLKREQTESTAAVFRGFRHCYETFHSIIKNEDTRQFLIRRIIACNLLYAYRFSVYESSINETEESFHIILKKIRCSFK